MLPSIAQKVCLRYKLLLVPTLIALLTIPIARENFLLFHTLIELFSILVAITAVTIILNTNSQRGSLLLLMTLGFASGAIVDLVHTLTYQGMGIIAVAGADTATRLWIAARFIIVISAFVAVLLKDRRMDLRILLPIYLLVTLATILMILETDLFPSCYSPETGLTPFKKISEYLIIGLFLLVSILLLRRKGIFPASCIGPLVLALLFSALAEFAFTLYSSVTDSYIVIGHLLKLISYALLYQAVIHQVLKRPMKVLYTRLHEQNRFLTEAQHDLARQMAYFEQLFSNNPDPILMLDADLGILRVNRAFTDFFGYSLSEIKTSGYHSLIPEDQREHSARSIESLLSHEVESVSFEGTRLHSSQVAYSVRVMMYPIIEEDQIVGIYVLYVNITKQKEYESQIKHIAYHDHLTGVYNRHIFTKHLSHLCSDSTEEQFAVLFLDINEFKQINDTYGHEAGDLVLTTISRNISRSLRSNDIIARLGGDEFGIIILGLHAQNDLITIRKKLEKVLSSSVEFKGSRIEYHVALGYSSTFSESRDPKLLLSSADRAMYEEKIRMKHGDHGLS